jgi:hypothetical protein
MSSCSGPNGEALRDEQRVQVVHVISKATGEEPE